MQPQSHFTVWDFFFRSFPERIIFISVFVDVLVIRAKEDEQVVGGQPAATSFLDSGSSVAGATTGSFGAALFFRIFDGLSNSVPLAVAVWVSTHGIPIPGSVVVELLEPNSVTLEIPQIGQQVA